MADDTKNATIQGRGKIGTNQVVECSRIVATTSTVAVAAAASAASVYTMCRIPSNMRIMGNSVIDIDDLASTGSPTLDIGFKAVAGNITTDTTDLNDGITAATAGTYRVVKDLANYGKQAWEFTSAASTGDPGGFFDVIITILDAATNDGGDLTLTLYGVMDT